MFKVFKNKSTLYLAPRSFSWSMALSLLFLVLASLSFWLVFPSLAAPKDDALAIRIYKNPNGYSALRWYNNEFPEDSPRRGAPQSIMDVDGYEAIRDGRTVYVNAGNLNDDGSYHANIYTLSFSQNSDPDTMKVHTDMLKHWTFNTNLIEPDDFGRCIVSTMICLDNSECKDGYNCIANKCQLTVPVGTEALSCWRDKDCPEDIFCDCSGSDACTGSKAAVTRMTKRYANLTDIMISILEFKEQSGYFPTLSSRTYVLGVSLSTWPSWNQTLAEKVKGGEFPVDPINTMGVCDGYDPVTCWDDVDKAFVQGNTANQIMNNGSMGSNYYGYSAEPGQEQIYSYSFTDGTISCDLNTRVCTAL